jgi:hypothetical protein
MYSFKNTNFALVSIARPKHTLLFGRMEGRTMDLYPYGKKFTPGDPRVKVCPKVKIKNRPQSTAP